MPLPGSGATLDRWQLLADVSESSASAGRLVEGHLDALAIVAELDPTAGPMADRGLSVPAGEPPMWGVWTARPDALTASPGSAGWNLFGTKPWCSGASALDVALVAARAADGPRLFVVDPGDVAFQPGSWEPLGMVDTVSLTAAFDVSLPASGAVGGPDAYVRRPGFGHGGAGVAACWLGAARALVEQLAAGRFRRGSPAGSVGSVARDLDVVWARLEVVAAAFDADAGNEDLALLGAAVARVAVAEAARRAVHVALDVAGAEGLCRDRLLQGRLTDLIVYTSQCDLEGERANLARRAPSAPGGPSGGVRTLGPHAAELLGAGR